jgi:2-oxoglutarate dehydrogenase E1 component
MRFRRDVFLDLLGYRKYGHNEGDEPRFTQPNLYKAISKHKNPRDIYAEKLIKEGIIGDDYVQKLEEQYKNSLEEDLEVSKKEDKTVITPFMADEWSGFVNVREWEMMDPVDTRFDREQLGRIAKVITELPKGKKFLRKVERLIDDRRKMFFETDKLDWAMGELLAYGTLLQQGYGVRISGQDVERGTFSHRHAVIKVEDSEEEVLLLNRISEEQGQFQIYNSLLSEYGVVGFDYGYAMASPNTLTIWEAQFGDFSNGAQIMIDQYISAAEDKWKLQNGLVLLLPHGYEGQGAEHSSARMERYLQLCARDNFYVADCTTPANLFHLFRRQMLVNFRKPLIVFTPKSLLRHPRAVSSVEELANGSFKEIIDDATAEVKKIKTLVFCTGKFYYDLLAEKEGKEREDVALVRVEQLFPLPTEQMIQIMDKYSHAKDVVWAQEEPKNMGAWSHLMMHFEEVSRFTRVAARRIYASPAAGSAVRSKMRHQQVIDYVFDKNKDNSTKKKSRRKAQQKS